MRLSGAEMGSGKPAQRTTPRFNLRQSPGGNGVLTTFPAYATVFAYSLPFLSKAKRRNNTREHSYT